MIGRYGTDGLNQFLSMSSIVMLLVSLLTRVSLFTWLGRSAADFVLLPLAQPQHFQAHGGELPLLQPLKDRFNNKFRSWKEQWANRKALPLLPLPPVPPEAARAPRTGPHPDLPAPAAAPSSSKKKS